MNNRKMIGIVHVVVNLLIVYAIDAYVDGTRSKIRNLLLILKKSCLLDKDQSNDISEIKGCVLRNKQKP
jgi:hypothetical protein